MKGTGFETGRYLHFVQDCLRFNFLVIFYLNILSITRGACVCAGGGGGVVG